MPTWLAQAGSDVILLDGIAFYTVNGGVEDIIVHVCQSADSVKEQLGAVFAFDSYQPIVVHTAVCDAHIWPAVLW